MNLNSNYPGRWLADLSWPQAEARINNGAAGVLPVGAGAKEHGYHLPLNTDQIQIEWLCAEIIKVCKVLVWPTVHYGYYPAFVDYPGSAHLNETTFVATVDDVLASMARSGHHVVYIVNSGISTIAPLERALENTGAGLKVTLINIYAGVQYSNTVQQLEQQSIGGHGDELETSIMMAIDEQRVCLAKAEPWTPARLRSGPFSRRDPDHPNFTPSGIVGDPTVASKTKGQQLTQAMLTDVVTVISTEGDSA